MDANTNKIATVIRAYRQPMADAAAAHKGRRTAQSFARDCVVLKLDDLCCGLATMFESDPEKYPDFDVQEFFKATGTQS